MAELLSSDLSVPSSDHLLAPAPPSSSGLGGVLLVLMVLGYFVPSAVALAVAHPQIVAIFVLNLFTGWTFVGWVAALVWALTSIRRG